MDLGFSYPLSLWNGLELNLTEDLWTMLRSWFGKNTKTTNFIELDHF